MRKANDIGNIDTIFEKSLPIPEAGCWIWQLALGRGGYGKISVKGKTLQAHRASWIAKHGNIPDLLVVCHKCDEPSCVNPDHLFLGTRKENSEDMVSKNRSSKGEGVGNSKLMECQIAIIRESHGSNLELAEKFGVCKNTIRSIRRGLTWRHV